MVHDTSLIVTIAAGLSLAFLFGMIAGKLKLPPLLGYLMAGVAVGPFTPGIVADSGVAHQLSEIGVTLLMFGVGLHFSIRDLWAVRGVALPGAVVQIAAATALGYGAGRLAGMTMGGSLVFGLCLSVASTVVLLRALGDRGQLDTADGRIAVGWLVVEDLATVIALVVLPALAGALGGKQPDGHEGGVLLTLGVTLGKVAVFAGLMIVLGKRLIPALLGRVARGGSREMFTLGVVAIALGIAFGASSLFGVTPALGAFFAGVIIAETDLSHRAGAEVLPLQQMFTVLFFVAVGMVFDPSVILQQPVQLIGTVLIVIIGKSIAACAIVVLLKYPIATALTVSASLAQIGEFSFILAGVGVQLGLMNASGMSLVLAAGVLSIAFNPLMFSLMEKLTHKVTSTPKLMKVFEGSEPNDIVEPAEVPLLTDHVVMVGFGRVGAIIGVALKREQVPFIVIDLDREVIEDLASHKVPTIFGDASRQSVLEHANLQGAKLLIVATPAKSEVREIVEAARKLRPDLKICVRSHTTEDLAHYESLKIQRVVLGELETAIEMAQFALSTCDVEPELSGFTVRALRKHGPDIMVRKLDAIPA